MDIKDVIHSKRIEHGMTMKDLAKAVGVSEGTISRWESGEISNMRRDKVARLGKILDIPVEQLMGWKAKDAPLPSNVAIPAARPIPILGTIGCGEGPIGEENYRGMFFVDRTIHADYALYTKGDSMVDAGIHDGDIALLTEDCDIEDGKIYGVIFGAADEAVLKKLYRQGNKVILQSCNSRYAPIVIDDGDMRVIGKLAWVCHKAQ
jgi:repressor LexA